MDFFDLAQAWFWFSLAGLLLAAELLTPGGFYFLLFAASAALTGVIAIFTDSVWGLLGLFSVVAMSSLFWIKPVLSRMFKINQDTRPSGVDAVIGKRGIVTKTITTDEKGNVKIDGEVWLARAVDGAAIEEGERVCVVGIDGTTLYVKKAEKEQ